MPDATSDCPRDRLSGPVGGDCVVPLLPCELVITPCAIAKERNRTSATHLGMSPTMKPSNTGPHHC